MVEVQRTVEAPADLGTDVIAIKAGPPVELEVRLESVVEGVLVTGSVARHGDRRLRAVPGPRQPPG